MEQEEKHSRVISNLVRFGCGWRTLPGGIQYYAWHGYPNRNDDYITYAEISKEEYERISLEYPGQTDAGRDEAERFRERYVNGHPVLLQGWNRTL